MSNRKFIAVLKEHWREMAVAIFMLLVSAKLFQIEENSEAIYDVETTVDSLESEIYQLRENLEKNR